MKNNVKSKRRMITSMLLILCVFVVGAIYISTSNTDVEDNSASENENDVVPVVEPIEKESETEVTLTTDIPEVIVDEVVIEETKDEPSTKEEVVVIEEGLPEAPEKPETTVPEVIPETKDDVTDVTTEPEYEDDQVTYEEETEPTVADVPDTEPKEDSNLVPDTENPFSNPENTGNPNEKKSSEYSDSVPGTGDKF